MSEASTPGVKKSTNWLDSIQSMRDMILGNLVLVGQIPAETFFEEERANFIKQRFSEFDKITNYQDEMGNVVGILKGRNSEQKIVVSASMDTRFANSVDHNMVMNQDRVTGAGVANNSMGLAALISLPEVIQNLGVEFKSDIVMVATTQSLGRGDLQGMRHFVKEYPFDIDFVLNLVGTNIGRVDHFCQSTVRADITCEIDSPDEFSSSGFVQNNAIIILNELINTLLTIPMSNRPKISMNIGKIKGGESYTTPCPKASLNLYVRSEDDALIQKVMEQIRECCGDVGSKNQAKIEIDYFGRQHAAGLRYGHPLVKVASRIVEVLDYAPIVAPSNTQIAVSLSRGIPSVTLGVTTGKQSTLPDNGFVNIKHIHKGMLQILMLINAIDKGKCDE